MNLMNTNNCLFSHIFCILFRNSIVNQVKQRKVELVLKLKRTFFQIYSLEIRKLDSQLDHLNEYMNKVSFNSLMLRSFLLPISQNVHFMFLQ